MHKLQVFVSSGVGSILDVAKHYEDHVIKLHFRLIDNCRYWSQSGLVKLDIFGKYVKLAKCMNKKVSKLI